MFSLGFPYIKLKRAAEKLIQYMLLPICLNEEYITKSISLTLKRALAYYVANATENFGP